ncbi:MarR family transcriptional regulator [Candidatus Gracilibacteria bacterium]|nr:MarR family transcriptional regulator [Candidatus Gracilibacteria bacterium]
MHPSFALKRAYLAMRKRMDEVLLPLGMTAAQFDVIQQLLHQDGLEHRLMQERLSVTSPTLTNVIDVMVERGFVERRISADDARVKLLFLTPKAHELHRDLAAASEVFLTTMFAGFSASEVALFREWLDRVTVNFERTPGA